MAGVEPLAVDAAQFLRTSEDRLVPIEVVPLASGGQYASRRLQGTFRYDWDIDHYPFDRQRIVIPIDGTQYGAGRLVLAKTYHIWSAPYRG